MNQVATDLWPTIFAAFLSALALYIGFINKMRSQISVLEEKVKRLETRQDNHSKKNDDIINLITEFKMEVMERIGTVNVQMGKISSDVENINNTIAIFDDCVVSRGNNKKKKNK